MRILILLASACLVGGTVEAQTTAEGRTRTVEREARRAEVAATALRDRVMERVMVADSAAMNRATLGISLAGSTSKRDTLGVFVESVTEDGPAERAGIYEGHRIAFINNVDVRASAADADDPYLSSVGGHRLVRAMRDVKAGNTVSLRVWTGSGYRDVQVTAARFADVYKGQRFGFTTGGAGVAGARMFHYEPARPSGVPLEMLRSEVRRVPSAPSVRVTPRAPSLRATPSAPSLRATPSAPSVRVAPGAMMVPRLAPTPSARRRFVI